jgi:hypothetical protein
MAEENPKDSRPAGFAILRNGVDGFVIRKKTGLQIRMDNGIKKKRMY